MSGGLIIWILFGLFLVGGMSGILGTFAFLRKNTLIGDAVAHSVLPGVVIGFLLTQDKNPWVMILGGTIFGLLSIRCIDWITQKSKLSIDTAIAIVTTSFFALGSVLLSVAAKSSSGNQAGLKDFLFGKAATLTQYDILAFGVVMLLVVAGIVLFYKPLLSFTFSSGFAAGQGWKVKRYDWMLSVMSSMVITVGLQAVGVVLMSALLIGPAAVARYWTKKVSSMLLLAFLVGAISGVLGGLLSLIGENMPTGPWIIMVVFASTLLTLLFAPNKGWLAIKSRDRKNRRQMAQENLLKTMAQLNEEGRIWLQAGELLDKRRLDTVVFERTMKQLIKQKCVEKHDDRYTLSEEGLTQAARIVRLHRLWELYLTARLNFKKDHIHGTAETIEHLITEEMEEVLLKELDFPEHDPHQKPIPYDGFKRK